MKHLILVSGNVFPSVRAKTAKGGWGETLTNSGKDRIIPESSTNYFRILSGLTQGYFMVSLGTTLFTDMNHSQSSQKK